MKAFTILFFACLFISFSRAAANEVGDGGDYVASEFIARGRVVLGKLRTLPSSGAILSPDDVAQFSIALDETSVESLDAELFDRNGLRVDARTVDHPRIPHKKLIQLYRPHWLQYFSDRANIYKLVFHEYLWVIGKNDSNYVNSNKIDVREGEGIEVRTCGLLGTMTERVSNCRLPVELGGFGDLATKTYTVPKHDPLGRDYSETFEWNLVARSPQRKHLWMDKATKTIWTSHEDVGINFYEARHVCSNDSNNSILVGLKGYIKVPSFEEYSRSLLHGLGRVLFDVDEGRYWTNSLGRAGPNTLTSTDERGAYFDSPKTDFLFLRCVIRFAD